jgi:hypothetical protein
MTLLAEVQPPFADVGEQQLAQLLDADRVEGQQPGQRRGGRGVGVQILPAFVQFHRDGSGEIRVSRHECGLVRSMCWV